jgi:hypothetical protein
MAEGPLVHRGVKELRRILRGERVRVELGVKHLKPLEASPVAADRCDRQIEFLNRG